MIDELMPSPSGFRIQDCCYLKNCCNLKNISAIYSDRNMYDVPLDSAPASCNYHCLHL